VPTGTIENLGEFAQGNTASGSRENDATLVAPFADHETGLGQGAEYLGEVRPGGAGPIRYILDKNGFAAWIFEAAQG
jgi:hypothetical protein